MNFNSSRRSADLPTRMPGVGLSTSFRCGKCDLPKSLSGAGLRRVRGLKTRVCAGCKREIDEEKHAK